MKNPKSFRNSGAFTSPGTPEYGDGNAGGTPKSWHSERVPFHGNRNHVNAAALMPFNSGRALPSKWDDAERWITSPVSGYGAYKSSTVQSPRRPKSRSGPQDRVYLSNYSPAMPAPEGGNARNFTANSPLTTGVLVPDGFHMIHYGAGVSDRASSLYGGQSVSWSNSMPGLSDLLSESSLPSSQDYKLDGPKEEEAMVSRVVSRRDMATQMSPDRSSHSSSKGRLSFSAIPSTIATLMSTDGNPAAKDEVRDVQVDKGTTTARQSKKKKHRQQKEGLMNDDDLPSPWNVAESSRNALRLQREEAKISAWENLQKAKAEAAIQKLEMTLEKKRSKSMDKILNKLRAAQIKAQAMRSPPTNDQAMQAPASRQWVPFVKHAKTCSFSQCCIWRRK